MFRPRGPRDEERGEDCSSNRRYARARCNCIFLRGMGGADDYDDDALIAELFVLRARARRVEFAVRA